jgi:hypothetical protein
VIRAIGLLFYNPTIDPLKTGYIFALGGFGFHFFHFSGERNEACPYYYTTSGCAGFPCLHRKNT